MKRILIITAALLCSLTCWAQSNTKNMDKKRLVAYYSATGTTKAQAEAIAKAVDATLYEITPEVKYTAADLDWRNDKSRSSIEMKDAASRPALGGKTIDASEYDLILVGYPIWWDLCPRVVNTWIESQKLDGKTLIPFATSGSSSIAGSVRDLRRLYPEVKWQDGKLLNCPAKDAAAWAKALK